MNKDVTNVVVAGLGGQGVLTASDILAEAAFAAGYDVKKSELHGMSQRGGSVTSDVRFGEAVLSPMVSAGEADFLLHLQLADMTAYEAFSREMFDEDPNVRTFRTMVAMREVVSSGDIAQRLAARRKRP